MRGLCFRVCLLCQEDPNRNFSVSCGDYSVPHSCRYLAAGWFLFETGAFEEAKALPSGGTRGAGCAAVICLSTMIKKAKTRAYQSLPDSEQITDPVRVGRLLERIAKQHTLLTVEIPGHQELYTSSIVGVDGTCVLLDELLPPTGHQLLLAERTLQVTGKVDGIEVRFVSTLERVEKADNMLTCHMNLPARIEYRQRRSAYRAHIPLTQSLRVIINNIDGTAIEGELHDLSHGGAGMLFPKGPPVVVRDLFYECAIELPTGAWLYCEVELCYSKSIQSRNQQLIGARLKKLSPAQARLVGQCISELERELARKRMVK